MEEIVTTLACGLKEAGIEPIVFAWTYLTQGPGQYELRLKDCDVPLVAPKTFLGKLATDWQFRVDAAESLAANSLWVLWPVAGILSLLKRISFADGWNSTRNRIRHWLLKVTEFYTPDWYMTWQLSLRHFWQPAMLVHQLGTGSPAAMRWAHHNGLAIVYSEGNTPGNDEHLPTWDSIRSSLGLARWLTALSTGARDGMVRVLGLPADRISVISGPVQFGPIGASPVEPATTEPDKVFRVLYVGRLDGWKGLTVLVRAIHWLVQHGHSLHLTLVGVGRELGTLTALVRELRLEPQVTFAGKIPHSELPTYYQAAEVLATPSLHFEGLGLVVPEAMSFGLPIVASDIPAFRDLVKHEENGLLTPAGNSDALAMALEWLINHPDERKQMGLQSRCRFEAGGLDANSFVQQFIAVYQKALDDSVTAQLA